MIGKTVDGILAGGYKIAYLSTINVTNISLRITVDKRWIWIFQKFPLLGLQFNQSCSYTAFHSPANIIFDRALQ